MTINCNYTLSHPSGSEYGLRVYNAVFEKDTLLVNVSSSSDGVNNTVNIYTTRDDSIDLAWSILEHYGVADRPPAPLAVGDLVEVTSDSTSGENNRLGKVVKQDEIVEDYLIRSVDGNLMGWKHAEDLARLTKEEFLKKASERAARFVGDDDA